MAKIIGQAIKYGLMTVSLILLLVLLACQTESSRSPSPSTLHLSALGKDTNPGTQAAPWRTLDKANKSALAGDVIVLHEGRYESGIAPTNSGRAESPIVFRAAPGERVILDAPTGIRLNPGSQYIIVEGFEIHSSHRVVDVKGASFITIRNCRFYGGRETYQAFDLFDCSYCVLQNNFLDRQDPDAMTGGGDGIVVQGQSHHNLIEGNTVIRCEHVAFSSPYGGQSYNVWRNNLAYYNHTNYALFDGVERSVFEGNVGYYQGLVWTGGSGNCLQFTGSDCIIRFNTLYDDTATAHPLRQWPAVVGSGTGSANGRTPSVLHNKIYNNTIYGENDQKEWAKSGWRIDNYSTDMSQNDNSFKNNIFAAAPNAQVEDIDNVRSLSTMHNRYEGNLLYGGGNRPALVRYGYAGGNSLWKLAEVKIAKPQEWAASNKEANPLFVNTVGQGPSKDFSLMQGSPAVDAALHLTTAKKPGSASTTLVVKDAGYFTDGWGIPGVVGDSLKIDAEAPVGISRVDYASNTITLNSPRSWATAARVYYYRSDRFQGKAPDIGARESSWNPGKISTTEAGRSSPAR